MSTASAVLSPPVAAPGAIIVIIADPHDWQEPLRRGVALASASGRKLKIILAGNDEIGAAIQLDCCRFVGAGGHRLSLGLGLGTSVDPNAARRLLQAQARRLRHELERLGASHRIAVELMVPALPAPTAIWTGGAALTIFGRRRGSLLVVHAGTQATLDLARQLAAERGQAMRVLEVDEHEPQGLGEPLGRNSRIATLVLDPLYVERRRLSLEALLDEARRLLQGTHQG